MSNPQPHKRTSQIEPRKDKTATDTFLYMNVIPTEGETRAKLNSNRLDLEYSRVMQPKPKVVLMYSNLL